jgi:hypothetical protein
MTAADVKFRVIRLPDSLRTAIRVARDANEWTNAEFVGRAVEQELPKLLESLRKLGFDRLGGQTRPMRLPFADDYGSLDLLREASQTVGLPAIQLLALCFLAATKDGPAVSDGQHGENATATKRRTPRRQSEGKSRQTKAPRRARRQGHQA